VNNMLFSFKAVNKSGERYEGSQEAKDQYDLARILRQKGDMLVSADETVEGKEQSNFIDSINGFLSKVTVREKIIFTRNLSAMISAGLSISRALEVMERQTRNKSFKNILVAISASVQKGNSLSVALAEFPKVFPPLFISMVKSGEESGKLGEALESVGLQLKKAYELKKRIRGAMIYPGIIITAMVIVGVVMLVFVVPTLTSTFEELGVELPKSTQLIISSSNFIKNNTLISLFLLIGIVVAFILALKNPKGRRGFDWLILHIPVIGELVKFTNSARTARTMGSLLQSGVEIVSSITITRDVIQNSYFKDVLAEASEKIPKGGAIAAAFSEHEKLYPPLVAEMISVGEETGNLPGMLSRIADFYEGEVDEKTKNLSTINEPFLMIIIGGVVGFFAVSMIAPIYSVGSGL